MSGKRRYAIVAIQAGLLIAIIAACFCIEIIWAKPLASELFGGLAPRLSRDSLYVAIGILGATVMPHNLYLHSALVQTRKIGRNELEKRTACRYNLIDSVVAPCGVVYSNAPMSGAPLYSRVPASSRPPLSPVAVPALITGEPEATR